MTPYLIIKGAAEAMDFYQRAFGATERFRMAGPDGKTIGHAEIVIGDSIVMMADESPQSMGHLSPQSLKEARPVSFLFTSLTWTPRSTAPWPAGATVKLPGRGISFAAERAGCVVDPFGHNWTLA